MSSTRTPLWRIMANAYAKATELGLRDLDMIAKGNAAEIRALADWLVPAEPTMPIYIGATGVDASIHAAQKMRQQLRQKLLNEANKAEKPTSEEI